MSKFAGRQRARSKKGLGRAAGLAGLCIALAVASAGAALANPGTTAQWHAAVQANLAKLMAQAKAPTQTKWTPIPANTPCRKPKTKQSGLVVGYAGPGLDNSAVVQIGVSTIAYLKSLPHVSKVIVSDAAENPSKQISDIQGMLTQRIDVLVGDPTTLAASPAFNQACQRGIPVVAFDRFLTKGTGVTATMYADEIKDGYIAGQAIV